MGTHSSVDVEFTLNGRQVSTAFDPRDLLLDVLRERFGLTGAKRSCDAEVCGTCTVLLDSAPVSSCTTLACDVDGKHVETIEGLAEDGELHPLQRSFIEHGALQCGFCTPGFILTAKALLDETPQPNREEIVSYLGGNICRCTGYVKILDAVQAVAEAGAAGLGHTSETR